ncbi:uncharacterized protein LOC105287460 isoform X2 [Ooceraea biroi]|uniref:uncharacterized protein LOC105287460 isoform X2 n=1 Tax=Ooceraea biroi TaxID=2015173 RepID=UPI0005BB4CFD|nr:uncharacterized protein LOC105287460 isoform X2 [Ooceraea biroi]
MKVLFSGSARALKFRWSTCCSDSRDRRCVERVKSFLLFFKLCGMFANEINKDRLKRCSRLFYVDSITTRLTVDFLKHLIGYISLSVNVIAAYTSQNHFGKFFDRLDSYDYEVARMNEQRRDNLWIPWSAAFFMTIIVLLLLNVMVSETSVGILFYVVLSDISTMIMHIYGTLEKFLILYLMLERFKHINNKIASNVTWDEKERGSRTITVPRLKMLYSMLYDAQQAFNDIYKNSLLIWFASLMIHVLANIRVFREERPLIGCAFVGPSIMQLLILCAICHYTAGEANRIPCVLSEYMSSLANSGETMTKIDILTYFLHNRVSFEAAGFFTINLPLFHSIIAAITTYFMILI